MSSFSLSLWTKGVDTIPTVEKPWNAMWPISSRKRYGGCVFLVRPFLESWHSWKAGRIWKQHLLLQPKVWSLFSLEETISRTKLTFFWFQQNDLHKGGFLYLAALVPSLCWLQMCVEHPRVFRVVRRAQDQDTMGELFTKYYRLLSFISLVCSSVVGSLVEFGF